MAFSAPTFIQPLAADHTRDAKIVVAKFTFDSSYATGGEAIDIKNQLGLSEIWFVDIKQEAPLTGMYLFQYDHTNAKILVFRQKDPAAAGGADIALPEVANATDLSSVTVRVMVYGLSS